MKTYYRSAVALLGMIAVLSFGACADDEIVDNRQGVKDGLGFSVSDIQDAPEDQTRTLNDNPEDYTVQSIDFTEEAGNACLQETTVPGVNPVKRAPATRSDFQNSIGAPFGAFACKNGSGKPDFFYNEKVAANGTMVSPKVWTSDESTLQFYAVYPYIDGSNPNLQLVQPLAGELPSVDFTTPTDIANQIDLMTASTQDITYTSTGGGSHVVPLTFYHSLTAIRFGVGSNLSWAKTIKSVEFQGVYSKGRYDIKTKTWSNQSATQNYKLDNIGVSTSEAVNNVILKDGHTFLMVPQTLPAGAKIVVTFSDGNSITAKIEGKKWKPGTTKTYMITEKNSNWNYIIQATSPTPAAYNQSWTGSYSIKSYRQVGTEQQAVAWKVVGYDANNDNIFSMNEKPDWVSDLSLKQGNGGTSQEWGAANIKAADMEELLTKRNAELKKNPKGNSGNYYDLSTHDIKGTVTPRNTANCYVISHPGFYKIPLVYGNAITAGNPNPDSYISSAPATMVNVGGPIIDVILHNFKDHNNQDITSSWIEKTNGGAYNGIDGAKLIWADEANLVHGLSISHDALGDGFLQFEVKAGDIKNGNAIVAATKNNVIVWSWHLWFAPDDVLNTTTCTNFQNVDYDFTKETLGWKYTVWSGSTFTQPRRVKVRVEQLTGNTPKQTAEFTITQNPGEYRQGISTLYQFGRKDALPGTNAIPQGNYSLDNSLGGHTYGEAIQNPDKMFRCASDMGNYDWCNAWYYNTWSINNTVVGLYDNIVIKTIYDPCPAGFRLPASNAFTGFTKDGGNYPNGQTGMANIRDYWNWGLDFYNKISSTDAIVYFPGSGYRDSKTGDLLSLGEAGFYSSAIPATIQFVNRFYFWKWSSPNSVSVCPTYRFDKAAGMAVRPVADE